MIDSSGGGEEVGGNIQRASLCHAWSRSVIGSCPREALPDPSSTSPAALYIFTPFESPPGGAARCVDASASSLAPPRLPELVRWWVVVAWE
ncbi:hypothetical protein E2C01_070791 [Portunus trituberculatus]|uniref:Uncharacterized protein n=1 Tax=Portunus trituberculatus TaxID=210409 RepID=A0A5B7HTN9_PORTR|nr:hypothetical protein [Portunus trituberculatus]